MSEIPKIDDLKRDCQRIYWFGLGFIQVVVGSASRYHFYVDSLPSITESPHNHRYNFSSKILKGSFTQTFFQECDFYTELGSKMFDIFEESCNANSFEEEKLIKTVALKINNSHRYNAGCSYSISHNDLHVVSAENKTITQVERGPILKVKALVARLAGTPKECPFEVKVPESQLWEIIDDCLRN
jgi:hypothetical protein